MRRASVLRSPQPRLPPPLLTSGAQLDFLNGVADNAEVSHEILMGTKAMTKVKSGLVKVVGGGELIRKGLVVKAHAFTASARQAITDNGGQCIVIPSYPVSDKADADAAPAEEAAAPVE